MKKTVLKNNILLMFFILLILSFGCGLNYSQKIKNEHWTLDRMADTINKYTDLKIIKVKREKNSLNLAYVVDLMDTLNKSPSFKLIKGHCYHYGYIRRYKSYSHLCFYFGKDSKFFSNVYCDSLAFNQAVKYYHNLNEKYKSEQTLQNIMNYRHFGKYYNTDEGPLRCK